MHRTNEKIWLQAFRRTRLEFATVLKRNIAALRCAALSGATKFCRLNTDLASTLSRRLWRVTSSGNYIPEIDGLRFIAIASVVLFHFSYIFQNNPRRETLLNSVEQRISQILSHGSYGVELFFIISGFILALPFAKQFLREAKPVRIGAYYLRRVTRLEPPYLLTLIGFYLASWLLRESDVARSEYIPTFAARAFYLHDLLFQRRPALNGVTWSLEIEVQFYVMVPLLVYIYRLRKALRRPLLIALIGLLPFTVNPYPLLQHTILFYLHYFLAGFLLADLYLDPWRKGTHASTAYDIIGFFALGTVILAPIPPDNMVNFLGVFLGVFVLCVLRGSFLRRMIALKPLCIIGGMCYTIYLLHYPFIVLMDRWVQKIAPTMGYLAGTCFLGTAAVLSGSVIVVVFFVCIERPCMDRTWPWKLATWVRNKISERNRARKTLP